MKWSFTDKARRRRGVEDHREMRAVRFRAKLGDPKGARGRLRLLGNVDSSYVVMVDGHRDGGHDMK